MLGRHWRHAGGTRLGILAAALGAVAALASPYAAQAADERVAPPAKAQDSQPQVTEIQVQIPTDVKPTPPRAAPPATPVPTDPNAKLVAVPPVVTVVVPDAGRSSAMAAAAAAAARKTPRCEPGFQPVGQDCKPVTIPRHAHSSPSKEGGWGWECNDGYRRYNEICVRVVSSMDALRQ